MFRRDYYEGTMVEMADGRHNPIQNLELGDFIRLQNGSFVRIENIYLGKVYDMMVWNLEYSDDENSEPIVNTDNAENVRPAKKKEAEVHAVKLVNVTYEFEEDLIEHFTVACDKVGVSQNEQVSEMMKAFVERNK